MIWAPDLHVGGVIEHFVNLTVALNTARPPPRADLGARTGTRPARTSGGVRSAPITFGLDCDNNQHVVFEVRFDRNPRALRDERGIATVGRARVIKKIPAGADITAQADILDIGECLTGQSPQGNQRDY